MQLQLERLDKLISIVEFEINLTKSSIFEVELFLAIKSYISCLNLKFSKSIIKFSHERREIKNTNVFIKKLKTLRIYFRDELK